MIDWLRIEAAQQGLALDDEDLEAIRHLLIEMKIALAAKRATIPEGTEPFSGPAGTGPVMGTGP